MSIWSIVVDPASLYIARRGGSGFGDGNAKSFVDGSGWLFENAADQVVTLSESEARLEGRYGPSKN